MWLAYDLGLSYLGGKIQITISVSFLLPFLGTIHFVFVVCCHRAIAQTHIALKQLKFCFDFIYVGMDSV